MDPKVKILVCCHKQDIVVSQEPYLPIQVGKALHPDLDLGILCDNTGENISSKNGSYCELTGMYWAWKNLKDVDIIGLCHYRRYFDFHGQGKRGLPVTSFDSESINKLNFDIPANVIKKIMEKGEVCECSPGFYKSSIAIDYCITHVSDDLRTLSKIISETQPDNIKEAYDKVMFKSNSFSQCNMFIMRKDDFDNYCEWLFVLLKNVEERINIDNYNSVQKRIFGYMAERLMNVWILANNKSTISFPVIWFYNGPHQFLNCSRFKYAIKKLYADLVFRVSRLSM